MFNQWETTTETVLIRLTVYSQGNDHPMNLYECIITKPKKLYESNFQVAMILSNREMSCSLLIREDYLERVSCNMKQVTSQEVTEIMAGRGISMYSFTNIYHTPNMCQTLCSTLGM